MHAQPADKTARTNRGFSSEKEARVRFTTEYLYRVGPAFSAPSSETALESYPWEISVNVNDRLSVSTFVTQMLFACMSSIGPSRSSSHASSPSRVASLFSRRFSLATSALA